VDNDPPFPDPPAPAPAIMVPKKERVDDGSARTSDLFVDLSYDDIQARACTAASTCCRRPARTSTPRSSRRPGSGGTSPPEPRGWAPSE
jgi:hypothetical protein